MSKQVEMPEGIEVFPARICECGAVHDRPEVGCPECSSVIARAAGDAIFVSDLEAIHKHFSDRLLSEEAVRAVQASQALRPARIEKILEAALQALSTPEVDRG